MTTDGARVGYTSLGAKFKTYTPKMCEILAMTSIITNYHRERDDSYNYVRTLPARLIVQIHHTPGN